MSNGFRPIECPNGCGNTDHKVDGDGFINTVMTVDYGDELEKLWLCCRCGYDFTEKEHNNYLEEKRTEAEIECGKFDREI